MRPFDFETKRGLGQRRMGLWGIVPWLNLVLVLLLLLVLDHHVLVTPGTLVEVAEGSSREGLLQGQMMLVLPVERANGTHELVLFFDDDRYEFSDERQVLQLGERVRALTGSRRELNLLVDRRVPQGDVMGVIRLLREAGVVRVNVVEKPL